jgi:hypothetical protein
MFEKVLVNLGHSHRHYVDIEFEVIITEARLELRVSISTSATLHVRL